MSLLIELAWMKFISQCQCQGSHQFGVKTVIQDGRQGENKAKLQQEVKALKK
jgi:hypothetical protein